MASRFLFAWRNALASEEGPKRALDRHVALTLMLYMNADGLGAWPSQDTLALKAALTDRTVGRVLQRLCDEKWLSREARKSPRGIRHKRYGYEYRARLPTKLANAYANGERGSLFTGRDPRKEQPKSNGEPGDIRIPNDVRTNTAGDCKRLASKKGSELTPQEIEDLDAFSEQRPA